MSCGKLFLNVFIGILIKEIMLTGRGEEKKCELRPLTMGSNLPDRKGEERAMPSTEKEKKEVSVHGCGPVRDI